MNTAKPGNIDKPAERMPPLQPMAPSPDLELIGAPIDPIGFPDGRAPPWRAPQVTRHSSMAAWLSLIALTVIFILGVGMVIWLAS